MQPINKFFLLLTLLLSFSATQLSAQCPEKTWNKSPKKDKAENAHVNYRGYVKGKTAEDLKAMGDADFKIAFDNWKIAYDIAPAADGQRPFHYRDGQMFYRAMRDKTEDAAKKKEYAQRIIDLYNEEMECYPDNKAYLLGRKAFDQFYLNGYSIDALNTAEQAMKVGGDKTEYIVLVPTGELLNYLFKEKQVDKKRVQEIYLMAKGLTEANQKGTYAQYYTDGMANVDNKIAEIESEVFDCAYFKENLLPKFEENRDSLDIIGYIYKKMVQQGCDTTDADVMRVKRRYDEIYATKAAEFEIQRRQMNPAYDANELYNEGDYNGAISRYREAIEQADTDDKKAQYYYQIASIQSGKLGSYGSARESANRAAQLNRSWGKPYILIGDIYGRMSAGCGDSWNQRLAVLAAIDKYSYAKSIDSSVAGDANNRIGRYSDSMPTSEEAFSRSMSAGAKINVGCGINETVTLRFQ